MFADLSDFEDNKTFEADLCIIGAGAAGITIARALVNSGLQVCLVESGGFGLEASTQALYEGEVLGESGFPLDESRSRQFGGSTALWGAQCRPLDEIDFEERPWVPNSGWPFGFEAVAPYYPEANEICGLGPYEYGVETWRDKGLADIPFDQTRLSNRLWQKGHPAVDFGHRYREPLKRPSNIHVLLHANALEFRTNADNKQIESIRVQALNGPKANVRARAYVLACGGIENARLLLASNGVAPAGLGNQYDLVGRYFMDHPHAPLATAMPKVPRRTFSFYHGPVSIEGTRLRLKVGLPPSVQRREELLNTCLIISVGVAGARGPGYLALKRLVSAQIFRAKREHSWTDLWNVVRNVDDLLSGAYQRLLGPRVLWLTLTSEQAPNRESRVTLSHERDALGMPKSRLDWHLTSIEKKTARYLCETVGNELERLGMARMDMLEWLMSKDGTWPDLEGQYHHMGTTRMHDDPKRGVVDRNCKIHGLANFYVAGTSVFPTSGYANPTLTLVALALRLAEHLKRELA